MDKAGDYMTSDQGPYFKTEEQYVGQFTDYVARRVARDLWRAMHPTGMHTNGPTRVVVEASHLQKVLSRWLA